jgi:hypothetical protein
MRGEESMKPEDWDTMTELEKRNFAARLGNSMRGQYLVGQALRIASGVCADRGEVSNAEDMEALGTLFAIGWTSEDRIRRY